MSQFDPPTDLHLDKPQRSGMPGWLIALIVIGVLVVLGCAGLCGGLVFIGAKSPDTFIYNSNQVPTKYVESAKDLGLLTDQETVLYFYSDGFMSVEGAMYILTDKHLILHNSGWADPNRVITFDEIVDVRASWSSQWIDDSMITVELTDGSFWSFPLSIENDTDHQFVDKLSELAGVPSPP